VLADQESSRVGNTLVQVSALLLVQKSSLRFVELVEGIGRSGVLGFIGVNEEGLLAVLDFDVLLRYTGLDVKDGVAGVVVSLDLKFVD
jgi:hypothetical protein